MKGLIHGPVRVLGHQTRRGFATGVQRRPLKLLYLGGDAFSVGVLQPLLAHKGDLWENLAVLTTGDKLIGRGQSRRVSPPLADFAKRNNLNMDVLPSTGFKDWKIPEAFLPTDPNTILITASFGKIIPTAFLQTHFPLAHTRLNVHPSLLPEYRGAAPIQRFIADSWRSRTPRDGCSITQTGVTVQSLALGKGKVDCGEIWSQAADVQVDAQSTYTTLLPVLARRGGEMLMSVLRLVQQDEARSYPQSLIGCFQRADKITRATAKIHWNDMQARQIESLHRGIGLQECLWTTINGNLLHFHDIRLCDTPIGQGMRPGQARLDKVTGRLLVRCADTDDAESLISVERVQQAGKRLVSSKDWWNGLRGIAKAQTIELDT